MKRQNGVALNGKLADLQVGTVAGTGEGGTYVTATLITDHVAYGGHHPVLFPEAHAPDVQAYWALSRGALEVAIEGWLRSTPASENRPATTVVVVDRVIYLTVTDEMRDQVAGAKAAARQGTGRGGRERAAMSR